MVKLPELLTTIAEHLAVSSGSMHDIVEYFSQAMMAGLAGRPSSLKMLPAFIGRPTGKEQGKVIAVDFGGTNVRVLLVDLQGNGRANIIDKRSVPLKDKLGRYDYTSPSASGAELFDFIADNIADIVPARGVYPLGHTFSFPCRQSSVNQAELISWTKEIKTAGVEGQNVGQLLQQALERKRVTHVKPVAVINDTTGSLLAAAYADTGTSVGSICGTGHNSCYLEPSHPLTGCPMIVNLESGNFDSLCQTKYDLLLDKASKQPGAQQLEKMVAGQYLGELVRVIVNEMATDRDVFRGSERLSVPYSLSAEGITPILNDTSKGLEDVAHIVAMRWGLSKLTLGELAAIKTVALLVAVRSARLVAATWVAILLKIDPGLARHHSIAVDGSLYEKLPGYADNMTRAIAEIVGDKAGQITVALRKDGSGIGAAVAAATVYGVKEGGKGVE